MIAQRRIYLGGGLLLAMIIAAIIGALLTNFPTYYRLSKYGVEAQGVVTSKERENHQTIWVEYEVDKHKFKVGGHAENFGKIFGTVDLNEKVPVYYNPEYPEESCLGNPNKELNSSIMGTCFVSTFPILFLLSYLIQKKSKQKSEKSKRTSL